MNRILIYHKYYFFCILSLMLFIVTEGAGQSLTINGGSPTLTITTGIAGGQLVDVVNTGCSLRYSTPFWPWVYWKITVNTSCPDQNFSLSTIATNVTRGTAAPEVTLKNGGPAIDFVTGIFFAFNASCTLQYTASATFAQGHSGDVGNDVHSVTYTFQQQ